MVITRRNPVHAALFLVLAFFNAPALWMLAEAEFLAIALVLVYVGAVMVLFLFVVMMLDINIAELRAGFRAAMRRWRSLVAVVMVVETGHGGRPAALRRSTQSQPPAPPSPTTTATPRSWVWCCLPNTCTPSRSPR